MMSNGVYSPTLLTALSNNLQMTSDNDEVLDLSMKKKSLEANDRKRRYSYAPMSSDESNTEEEVDKPGGLKRVKTARKLELEELTTSPVSGTIIRDLDREIPMPIHRGKHLDIFCFSLL